MKAILFDLDGTLLPMDMDRFTTGYFKLLAQKTVSLGYDPKELVDGIWKGTYAMVKNDGTCPNKDRFWSAFAKIFGEKVYNDIALFDDFYCNEFRDAVTFTAPSPAKAQAAVKAARARAEMVVLATNPIFPRVGVETRLSWLGLQCTDFDYVTTYENSTYCKPNPCYYQQILSKLELDAADCLMIGNDVEEDILASRKAGLASYLVLDCVINKSGETISPAGSFDEMLEYLAK